MAAKTRQYRFKQKIGHIQLKNKLATVGKKREKIGQMQMMRVFVWLSLMGRRCWTSDGLHRYGL